MGMGDGTERVGCPGDDMMGIVVARSARGWPRVGSFGMRVRAAAAVRATPPARCECVRRGGTDWVSRICAGESEWRIRAMGTWAICMGLQDRLRWMDRFARADGSIVDLDVIQCGDGRSRVRGAVDV